ncbi:TIM barrel protein [Kineococcus gynurae]|uniref:3-dehydroshikimate dehydratase n=1 Tax=Kineococcus gynurae TaxID=452979 RepID=A0ABV5LVH8_9ACTN
MPAQRVETSIATVCLSGTLPEKIDAAAAAGFDAVEIFEPDLLGCPSSPAEIARRVAGAGLRTSLYQPFRDPDHTDPARLPVIRERLRRKAALTRELGTDLVLVCSSVHPHAVREDDRLAEQLHALGAVAAEQGVRLAYEALAWGTHVKDYRHSLRVARRAAHPNVGVCLDSFHVLSRGDDPGGLGWARAEELLFLQLADAPRLSMDVLPWSRHHRLFPGQGGFDLVGFVDAVLAAGYTGPLSLEVFNDVFRQSDPRATALDAMRSLRHLAEGVDRSTGEAGTAVALPTPPRPLHWAFAEIGGAPGAAADGARRTLEQLGFYQEGQHQSGPITLWRSGSVRVVVNARGTGGARLTSLGLRVPEPGAAAARARGLLAPVVTRSVGPGEVDIPSVTAPDGTWLQFCDLENSWLQDFFPLCAADAEVAAERPAALVFGGVDHIALPQGFGGFDRAALFLSAVLDLQPTAVVDIAGPDGLVRSRALLPPVADEGGGVRLVLNVAPSNALLRGRTGGGGHLALVSSDAVAAAAEFRSRGGRVLDVPGNYYDDLEARGVLDPGTLARLRENSVLYDVDEHGELLHFFTANLGPDLFLEVVQRIGGYRGFGAGNAAVRLLAQTAAAEVAGTAPGAGGPA